MFRRPFVIRSRERDIDTDRRRLARLDELIATLSAEIAKERSGLEARYKAASGDASFAQQAYEDDEANAALSRRIDELTATIMRVTERLDELDRQKAYLASLRSSIAAFGQTEKDPPRQT